MESDEDDVVCMEVIMHENATVDMSSLEARLKSTNEEIETVEMKLDTLQRKLQFLKAQKEKLKSQMHDKKSEDLRQLDWERNDHSWSERLRRTLKEVFKLKELRPMQLPAINGVMSGQDVILIMPTGGGKSLCFQLAAHLLPGMTVVVSPLVSLMEDQVMALRTLNVQSAMLSATMSKGDVTNILNAMTDKTFPLKLLYVTPERMAKSKRFMTKLQKAYTMGRFSLLAIDEVHCCSQWGHDFRPDYKFLGIMKRQYPNVPILGLTATSTTQVTQDVQKMLSIQGCLVLKGSFNRPNLNYKVLPKSPSSSDAVDELAFLIQGRFQGQSGIVYCFSIKESEELCRELQDRGVPCGAYHAQLEATSRSEVHRKWSTDEIQVVVATIAFGMGIDKPNVRFVIHHSLSKSMENYYQESGRAGRDDAPAECILYYRLADVFRQSCVTFTEQTGLPNLYTMMAYCIDHKRCRRQIIADHFGEKWTATHCDKMCDHCHPNNKVSSQLTDVTKSCQALITILEHADDLKERLTSQKLLDVWQGKGVAKLRVTAAVTSSSRETCELLLALLLIDGFLKEDFHFTPYANISYIMLGTKAKLVKSGKLRMSFELPNIKRKSPPTSDVNLTKKLSKEKNAAVKSLTKKVCVINSEKSKFGGEAFSLSTSTSNSGASTSENGKKKTYSRISVQDSDSDLDFEDWDELRHGKK